MRNINIQRRVPIPMAAIPTPLGPWRIPKICPARLIDARTRTHDIDTAKLARRNGKHALELRPLCDVGAAEDGTWFAGSSRGKVVDEALGFGAQC
jgi:hypothetical protein